MNKNLNLVNILKDCPKGKKLYSTIHGEVEFVEMTNNDEYPIKYQYKSKKNNVYNSFVTADGRYSFTGNGECILFPSKDQRDWSKFNIEPKFAISTLQPFDKVLCRINNDHIWNCDFFSHMGKHYYKFICIGSAYTQCIPYNEETYYLIGTTNKPPKEYINWEE